MVLDGFPCEDRCDDPLELRNEEVMVGSAVNLQVVDHSDQGFSLELFKSLLFSLRGDLNVEEKDQASVV